jgi:hypothetical protein
MADMTDGEFEDFLAGGDGSRGGLFYWNLLDSYEMVCEILDDAFTHRNELVANLKEPATPDFASEYSEEYAESQHVDNCHRLTSKDVACSVVAVGAIAPLTETLESRAARRWRSLRKETERGKDEARRKQAGLENSFVPRFRGLLGSLDFEAEVPADSLWSRIDALFEYRNSALHMGYEWPEGVAKKFAKTIEKNGWDEWFGVTTRDGTPWLISMRDPFIRAVLADVKQLANTLREIDRELSPPPPTGPRRVI